MSLLFLKNKRSPNLKALPFDKQHFRKPKRQPIRPSTGNRTACKMQLGCSELIEAHVASAESRLDSHATTPSQCTLFRCISAPKPLDITCRGMPEAKLQPRGHCWSTSIIFGRTQGLALKFRKERPMEPHAECFFPKESRKNLNGQQTIELS